MREKRSESREQRVETNMRYVCYDVKSSTLLVIMCAPPIPTPATAAAIGPASPKSDPAVDMPFPHAEQLGPKQALQDP